MNGHAAEATGGQTAPSPVWQPIAPNAKRIANRFIVQQPRSWRASEKLLVTGNVPANLRPTGSWRVRKFSVCRRLVRPVPPHGFASAMRVNESNLAYPQYSGPLQSCLTQVTQDHHGSPAFQCISSVVDS